MKKYIYKNLEPLLIGLILAFFITFFFELVSDIIIKISLIKYKQY